MLAAKNSIKRQAAFSPARAIAAGSRSRPARVSLPLGIGTTERVKLARVNDEETDQMAGAKCWLITTFMLRHPNYFVEEVTLSNTNRYQTHTRYSLRIF
jgi:hypothetical protein